jgi:CHAP domain
MVYSIRTADEAIALFKTFIGKPRTSLPWLKGRVNMLDCAAGYSWISGLKPEQISCSKLKAIMVKNGTWKTTGIPEKGDAVLFDWSGNKTGTDHVGIVISANKNAVVYISADSGKNQLVTINPGIGYKWISGFGKPIAFRPTVNPNVIPLVPVAETVHPAPKKPVKPAVYMASVVVLPGDSYWKIAARSLGVANNLINAAKIQKETKRIQALNNNKPINPGDKVRIR